MYKLSACLKLATCITVLIFSGCQSSSDQTNAELVQMVEQQLEVLAMQFSSPAFIDSQVAFSLLGQHLTTNPDIYGAAFAFAPVETENEVVKSSPYVYRSETGLVELDLFESYDYTAEAWYSIPVERSTPVWSDPYFDEGGGDIWMITYSMPVYDEDGQLFGVITSDLPVEAEGQPE